MASVGTVSVKVVPDLDGFADAVRQEVRRIVREEIAAALDETRTAMTYTGAQISSPAEQIQAGRDYMKRTYGGSVQKMTDPYGRDDK